MLKSYTFLLFSVFLISQSYQSAAQCSPAAPAEGVCSGGSGAAFNGVNINGNHTYWYSGSGTFSNGVNINNGGTLRVCGNLTLSQINLNGGTIIVASGGTLTINGSGTLNLNNNVTIVNYGTLNINRDVQMQNNGNVIINATHAAVIQMPGHTLTISGSNASSGNILINKGTIYLKTLEITSNSNGVCLGDQSILQTEEYKNSKTNAITVEPGAVAVLRITVSGRNDAPLSASANLHICKSSAASFSGSSSVGSATIYENCSSAAAALPITLKSFQTKVASGSVLLVWETAAEKNNDFFLIERSTDGVDFETVSERIPGAGNSEYSSRYTWTDPFPAAGINYYRLKQVDLDGTVYYHGIRTAKIEQGAFETRVFPNPVTEMLSIRLSGETASTISILDMTGRRVFGAVAAEGRPIVELDLSALPSGNYTLSLSNEREIQSIKLVKQ